MQLFDCATWFVKNIARKRTKDVKNEGEMLRYITETKGFLCQSQEVYRVGSTDKFHHHFSDTLGAQGAGGRRDRGERY